jgi:hypothetical protein
MSDGSLLLLVLWLLYLSECLLWISRHSVVFAAPWSWNWSAVTAGEVLGSASGSPRLLNPFPPLGRMHKVELLPVAISPTHIASFNAQTVSPAGRPGQPGGVVDIDAIRSVTVRDSELLINGHRFAKIANRDLRASLATLIEGLRARPESVRSESIEKFWRPQFDLEDARAAVDEAARRAGPLAAACNGQFLLIFVALPVLSLLKGLDYVLIPGAIAMEFMAIQISLLYFLAHRRLHPRETSERVAQVAKMVLCAPLSIRAVDALTAPAAGRFHILTVASAPARFPGKAELLGRLLRDLRHPVGLGSMNEPLAATCRWQNNLIERVAADTLPEASAIIRTLDAPPPRLEAGCRCYCPRCLAQLSIATETCPDCPAVRMVAVSDSHPLEA